MPATCVHWQLVGEGFRQQGYAVREHGGAGGDGGIDLVLMRNGETFLVQCKQWRAFKVGVDVVRELYGVMAKRGAAGGFVVTSGQFTDDGPAHGEERSGSGVAVLGLLAVPGLPRNSLTARMRQS